MIHIAICDDNLSDTERIEEQLLLLQSKFTEKLEINVFYSGESFCRAIDDNCPFDIVLMDIEMNGIDGITAGKKLRADDENDLVLLLYISSYDNYFRQLFDVQPYSFIEKPINSNEFYDKLEKAINKTLRRRQDGKRQVLPICQRNSEVLIPFHKILYLESRIRKICLFTTDGMIEYYSTLNKEEQKLSNQFIRTHQSYIVNLHHVKIVASEGITLVNNIIIPISSSRKSSVKNHYMEYRRNFFD